ncbi:hypothetical protein [Selenomonas ruminantium]|uniref:Uncharacterized protein n=1 Tax=Selenomonas ruminantium TaxID=971 RepID=A0A1H3YVB9_SELRU|nr:hypothetical protein [Selenomonas ruminantium]SEA15509.1 hypothetical protein SAMN05660648_02160 [Selenomonas ruminantium]
MDIYVLEHSKMGQKGESLLKLIQNTSLSTIDLLVRESIQNSLDAAKKDSRCVKLDILTGTCSRKELDKIFTNITDALKKKYPGNEASYIAVRDSGTVGLTGPLCEADVKHEKDFGNLRKLIYEICEAQPEKGKGGSWGLGKTVYFRVGIGIVLYYSRIKLDDGSFASRMAAALIEDNSKKDSLLRLAEQKNGNFYCGVAWWGALHHNGEYTDTVPITNEKEIAKILDIFDLPPYEGEETGTTVIIPYVDFDKLHDNANTQSFEIFNNYSLEEMINLSVQRWYAPRLYNNNYKYGAFLDYRCNGSKLRSSDRAKFFDIIKELYNDAEKGERVALYNEFRNDTCAGYLYWRIVSRRDLNMLSPNNEPSPIDYLLKTNKDDLDTSNPPILAYCRKAGMIVNYELRGEWVSGVRPTREDEYLIAFFVLNGDNIMLDNPEVSLDEYIRQGEKADHMSWQDHVLEGHKYKVVRKLHNHVSKKLKEVGAPDESNYERRNDSALQRMFGSFFLPPQNFGRLANSNRSKKGNSSSKPSNKNRKTPGLNDIRIKYVSENELDITWKVILKKKQKNILHELLAMTSTSIHAKEWEDEKTGVGLPFPFNINSVYASYNDEPLNCKLIYSKNNIAYGFEMDTRDVSVVKKEKNEIFCRMIVDCKDASISCNLIIREAEK